MGSLEIVDRIRAAEAAEEARSNGDVKRWIRRLKRLVRDMPDGVDVFVGAGVVCVQACGPGGVSFMTEFGGVEPEATVDSVEGRGRWDGGDW